MTATFWCEKKIAVRIKDKAVTRWECIKSRINDSEQNDWMVTVEIWGGKGDTYISEKKKRHLDLWKRK